MKNWGFQREKFYMGIYVGLFKRKRVLLIKYWLKMQVQVNYVYISSLGLTGDRK